MTQFAEIVLAAKSDQIRRAKGDLDGLSRSGGQAEKSAINLTRAMAGLAVAVGAVGGALLEARRLRGTGASNVARRR